MSEYRSIVLRVELDETDLDWSQDLRLDLETAIERAVERRNADPGFADVYLEFDEWDEAPDA